MAGVNFTKDSALALTRLTRQKFDPAASGASMSIFARKAACVRLGRDAGSLQLAIQAKLLMHTVAHLQCQPWLHVSVQKAAAFQDLA